MKRMATGETVNLLEENGLVRSQQSLIRWSNRSVTSSASLCKTESYSM